MDIKHTCDSIEKILCQLEAQNKPVNSQKMLILKLLAKFPNHSLLKLEQSKEPTTRWTMENLLFVKLTYKKMLHILLQVQMYIEN